jgi:hypothetical protein
MTRIQSLLALCALPLAIYAGQALAEDVAQALQQQQTENGGTFVTGGVGDEEMAQLKSTRSVYNLHVLFTGKGGEFQSGVKVQIANAKGDVVLDTTTTGPYLYAKLPAGKYKINATLEDHTQSRSVQLASRGGGDTHIVF